MEIIYHPRNMTSWSNRMIRAGRRIALVPTMGYFHEGHAGLMRLAGEHADLVVVSLFVNPLQFGPDEDLDRYPRDFTRDRRIAEEQGVSVLFAPRDGSMYDAGHQTTVQVHGLTKNLCGAHRPGHFTGVTTVVAKLFHLVKPHCAVFGEKDYQQLAVIRKMTADLNWDIEIIAHPLVREADGLALSSRNRYLTPEMRKSALSLSRGIRLARELVAGGIRESDRLRQAVRESILAHPDTAIEYISFVDRNSLREKEVVDADTLLALAVNIDGKVRLIDNAMLFTRKRSADDNLLPQ